MITHTDGNVDTDMKYFTCYCGNQYAERYYEITKNKNGTIVSKKEVAEYCGDCD